MNDSYEIFGCFQRQTRSKLPRQCKIGLYLGRMVNLWIKDQFRNAVLGKMARK